MSTLVLASFSIAASIVASVLSGISNLFYCYAYGPCEFITEPLHSPMILYIRCLAHKVKRGTLSSGPWWASASTHFVTASLSRPLHPWPCAMGGRKRDGLTVSCINDRMTMKKSINGVLLYMRSSEYLLCPESLSSRVAAACGHCQSWFSGFDGPSECDASCSGNATTSPPAGQLSSITCSTRTTRAERAVTVDQMNWKTLWLRYTQVIE